MKFRNALVAAACAATMGGISIPSASQAAVVYFNDAPPAPRIEVVPAPRRGYVWAPGYWDVRGHRHVWRRGHWERARRGWQYREPHWVQDNNRWRLERGGWAHGDRQR